MSSLPLKIPTAPSLKPGFSRRPKVIASWASRKSSTDHVLSDGMSL